MQSVNPGITVRKLTPELLGDWLRFFDEEAFADNPDWSECYCQWFHVAPAAWEVRTAEQNRDASIGMIRAGRLKGCVAYVGGRPVGWCHAAPRVELPNIVNDPELTVEDPEQVGSIVCFVVAAAFRRQGVATMLLQAACNDLRDQGLGVAEAYPSKLATNDATHFHGPLSLYTRAGFTPYREGESLVIVRRQLVDDAGLCG